MPSRYDDNSISRVSLEDDGFKTKKLYLNSTPTIKPIDSLYELKDHTKRLEIRNFINSECVKRLKNQELITSSILKKLDELDKLDKQDVDLTQLQDNINIIISIIIFFIFCGNFSF